ncbi:hypothetical protein HK105_201983 [Polyrhizophydium stewartii]|uniref:C2H2-type domain-containing protein n=1 Tax=Polyrhizophydium stewartii TaxID=2732419 RepID=A0ABR4NGF1_9FUNG
MVHKAQASASAPANRHAFACETCGKRYKHPHCLSKHRWEHTEHWKETSNLSISKHQRVLLLEAASVLVDFSAKSAVPQRTPPSRQGVPDNDEFDNDDNDDNDDIDADDTGIRDHDDDEFIDVERLSDADGHPGLAAQALMLGSTSSLV